MNKTTTTDVLIFNDDPYYGNFLLEIFEKQGLKAKCFSSGENAVRQLREEKPSLIVLDLSTPGLNGMDICEAVKNDSLLHDAKIVVVSGDSFPDDKARAVWAQADLYIPIPFDVSDFSEQTGRLLPQHAV